MREHAYEIPSKAIAAHWWVKYYMPKLLAEAERVRQAQEDALAACRKAMKELDTLRGVKETKETLEGGIYVEE